MDNADFYSRSEGTRCRAGLPGCTYTTEVHIFCKQENHSIDVCQNCSMVWRNNAKSVGLYDRCPLCAEWRTETVTNRNSPAAPPILTGLVADVLEAAMDDEGFSHNQITQVLRRLAKDQPWLYTAEPASRSAAAETYHPQWENVPTGNRL